MKKSTYGTGCIALLNTGDQTVTSSNRLLTAIAYQFGGKPTYALEGSYFIAGAVVQWLRDGLKIIREASEIQVLAENADPSQNVVLVHAFLGLGAPYWHAECCDAVFGLTRGTGPSEFATAALEPVGFQARDLLEAMRADWAVTGTEPTLRVDGGMTASDWSMQFLAGIIGADVLTLRTSGEPDLPKLEAALDLGREFGAEVVLGVGGGSVLDLGKAVAALIPGTSPLWTIWKE